VKVDAELESLIAGQPPVHYVSMLRALCDADGCLTHAPGSPTDLLTWDYGHFTTPGAEVAARYLVDHKILQ
jgi:hypothetical protein